MPRLLAVDWDRHEARYVLAVAGAEGLVVRRAASVPLVDVAEGGNAPHPDIGGSLRAALAEESVGRVTTLVGVERSAIELLHFTLPPASDAELPEMVINQAIRESQLVTEESVLDFVPSSENPSLPREVTAGVLSAEQFEQILAACEMAGLKPKRLVLRPYAGASLFRRMVPAEDRVCLLVNLIAEEVDLTFLSEGKVAFFRTVRLPKTGEERAAGSDPRLVRRLLTEISRTLVVAAQSQIGDDKVQCVYVFGDADEHQALAEEIHHRLDVPVQVLDPFDVVESSDRPQGHAGRFASLLGMLHDEAQGARHAIDFLNPRRPPQPPNRRRMFARLGGLAFAALLFVAYIVWGQLADLDTRINDQLRELKNLDELAKQAARQQQTVASLHGWETTNVIWLDELRDLSLRFPSGRDMVVLRITMSGASEGGGSILLNGLVRDPAIVVRMEGAVRDRYHVISSKRVQERVGDRSYSWHFETSMLVAKRDKSGYVSHLPGSQPAAPSPPPPEAETPEVAQRAPSNLPIPPADQP